MCTALVPTARLAAKARTLKSGPGNKGEKSGQKASRVRGFTLIELLVVVALIAIASGLMSLSLRDPAGTQLENEAARLAALLESARAESRTSGMVVRWEPHSPESTTPGFTFVGVTNTADFPTHWLGSGVSAEIVGSRAVVLGPEPLIAPQRIVLRLEDQRLALATDGLGPFVVVDGDSAAKP
ncbi:MAG: prepilin-type N-terminal cleavage/methylation domain-containing protein [Cytophagales bacterium]|nr:prepilin-type N-terminal cleavage/methylation domain-containing protein [Rhizobacter sp.]